MAARENPETEGKDEGKFESKEYRIGNRSTLIIVSSSVE